MPFTNETHLLNEGPGTATRVLECPLSVMADSYKGTHLLMYPDADEMRVYGTFRSNFKDHKDRRVIVYGIKYYVSQFISRSIDETDIKAGRDFMKKHIGGDILKLPAGDKNAGKDYFDLLQAAHNFPVKIEALPEGSVIYPGVPAYIITAKGENSRLCAFLETILTMIWYPSTVATLSRHTKTLIEEAFVKSVSTDDPNTDYDFLLNTRLHDFGFRGCTCVEQSVIGGSAHLLNFNGSDTMSACYHVTEHLNGGDPIGHSIPATEHSVMTSWPDEVQAITNLCKRFPGQAVACVMDSYDYENALDNVLKEVKDIILDKKCKFIIRPDSGDPVDQVLLALEAGRKHFGGYTNSKGFFVLDTVSVLQGDGIDFKVVENILYRVLQAGFSAQNVAFGMGGGLLQKVNRDTMQFATKLSYTKVGGVELNNMKCPAGEEYKWSLPGKLMVLQEILSRDSKGKEELGPHTAYSEEAGMALCKGQSPSHRNSMRVVYDGIEPRSSVSNAIIKQLYDEKFSDVRARLNREWDAYNIVDHNPISKELKEKQDATNQKIVERIAAMKKKYAPPLASNFTEAGRSILKVLDKTLNSGEY